MTSHRTAAAPERQATSPARATTAAPARPSRAAAPPARASGSPAGVPLFLRRPADHALDTAGPTLASRLGEGMPLDAGTRAAMEARLGAQLSDVRIHAGRDGAAAALAAGAAAFALGRDVAFAPGRYAPHTEEGRRLLLHELAHVLQQRLPASSAAAADERVADAAPTRAEHDAERVAGAPAGRMARVRMRTPVRLARAPGTPTREDLEKTYKIRITKGDRDWSADDLADLAWSLGRLSTQERAIVDGYEFQRWTSRANRVKLDPTYKPSGHEESGLHQLTLGGANTARISMYDEAFDPSTTMGGEPVARFTILHEIGHAAEMARARKAQAKLDAAQTAYDEAFAAAEKVLAEREAANDERNRLASEHDEATDEATRRALRPKVEKAIAAVKKLDERLTAAQALATKRSGEVDAAEAARKAAEQWTVATFAELVAGEDALTPYSATSLDEAFAEAFALYKLDPKGLEQSNKRLHDWFKAHGELTGVAPASPKAKAKAKGAK